MSDDILVTLLWIIGGLLFVSWIMHRVGTSKVWHSHGIMFDNGNNAEERRAYYARMDAMRASGERCQRVAAWIYGPIFVAFVLGGLGLLGMANTPVGR